VGRTHAGHNGGSLEPPQAVDEEEAEVA
jgi:hypothetical protein